MRSHAQDSPDCISREQPGHSKTVEKTEIGGGSGVQHTTQRATEVVLSRSDQLHVFINAGLFHVLTGLPAYYLL